MSRKKSNLKPRIIGRAAWVFTVLLAKTLRLRVHDEAGVTDPQSTLGTTIWTLWHNRVLMVPYVRTIAAAHRHGAVLTSASGDGAILAAVVRCFGIEAVQGSSSRGGVRAVIALQKWLGDGYDICITPDGPRGPKYHVNPGVVHLAQQSGAKIVPISVTCSRSWRLRSWDGFMIPKPFSRVDVTFCQPYEVKKTSDTEAFEQERLRLQEHLMQTVGEPVSEN